MKYLKITVILFALTCVFASYNVSAGNVYNINNITIPALKGIWTSSQQVKYDSSVIQTATKISCTDDWSSDGRVILARAMQMLSGGYTTTDWLELPPKQAVSLGTESKKIGNYKLLLQSNKSLLSTATFTGTWVID